MAKRKAARRVRPVRGARKQASPRSSAKRAAPEKGANKRGTARKAEFGEGILKRCSSGFKRITLPRMVKIFKPSAAQ